MESQRSFISTEMRRRHEKNGFTTEHVESFQPGETYEVTECVLPASYYYVMEHALGISKNFKNAERLKTTKGTVVDTRKTSRFDFVILEFDE